MLIGVPREIKAHEYRVGMTPASVREAVHHGHRVVVQHDCGAAIGFRDDSYVKAGAEIAMAPDVVFGAADMRWDASSSLPLELALVESSLRPDPVPAQIAPGQAARAHSNTPTATSSRQPDARPPTPKQAAAAPRRAPPQRNPQPNRPTPAGAPEQPLPSDPAERLEAQLPHILRSLRNAGSRFKLDALLRSSKGFALADRKIVVRFGHNSHYDRMREELQNPDVTRQLRDVINGAMGDEYEVVPELDPGTNGSTLRQAGQSPLVRAAQSMGARIVEQREDDDS